MTEILSGWAWSDLESVIRVRVEDYGV